MMTPRENAMAIFNREQPDYYGDIMGAVALLPDPILMSGSAKPDGKPYKNIWGVTYMWKPGAPGQHPVINDENKVIKDITKWESQLNVPSLEGLDWTMAKQVESTVDRKEKMVCIMFGGGLFEMSHFLMGMEDALCNYLEKWASKGDGACDVYLVSTAERPDYSIGGLDICREAFAVDIEDNGMITVGGGRKHVTGKNQERAGLARVLDTDEVQRLLELHRDAATGRVNVSGRFFRKFRTRPLF